MNLTHPLEQLNQYSGAAIALAQQYAGDFDVAVDLVNDTMLKLCQVRQMPVGHELKLWFLKAVRNYCIDHYRRQQKHQQFLLAGSAVTDPAEERSSGNQPLEELIQADQSRQLQHAFAQLNQTARELLALREFNQLAYREIALITGLPIGSVMSGISRAREQLRQLMFAPTECN